MKKLGKILAVGAAGAAAAAVVNAGRKKAEAETRRIADEEVKSRDYGERKVYLVGEMCIRDSSGSYRKAGRTEADSREEEGILRPVLCPRLQWYSAGMGEGRHETVRPGIG